MSRTMTRVVVSIAAIGLALALQASTSVVAGASTPLTITGVSPNPVVVNVAIGGSAKTHYSVTWSGKAVFPMTMTVTPEPSCSTGSFTCTGGSKVFTVKTRTLSTKYSCSINAGSSPGSNNGTWDIKLTDSAGHISPIFSVVETCNWS
jgi:hypothetical protein